MRPASPGPRPSDRCSSNCLTYAPFFLPPAERAGRPCLPVGGARSGAGRPIVCGGPTRKARVRPHLLFLMMVATEPEAAELGGPKSPLDASAEGPVSLPSPAKPGLGETRRSRLRSRHPPGWQGALRFRLSPLESPQIHLNQRARAGHATEPLSHRNPTPVGATSRRDLPNLEERASERRLSAHPDDPRAGPGLHGSSRAAFFNDLVAFMTSGPSWFCAGRETPSPATAVRGATNPPSDEGTIRKFASR